MSCDHKRAVSLNPDETDAAYKWCPVCGAIRGNDGWVQSGWGKVFDQIADEHVDGNWLLHRLRDWRDHYDESIFPEPGPAEDMTDAEQLQRTLGGAAMGRHILDKLIDDVEKHMEDGDDVD